MVKLKGLFDSLCHDDVVAAVEVFGKTKSVLLMKLKQEVCTKITVLKHMYSSVIISCCQFKIGVPVE